MLSHRNLLILQNATTAKTAGNTEVRYTAGKQENRGQRYIASEVLQTHQEEVGLQETAKGELTSIVEGSLTDLLKEYAD